MRPEVFPVLPWTSSVPTTTSRFPSLLMSPTAGVSATLAGRESTFVVGSLAYTSPKTLPPGPTT